MCGGVQRGAEGHAAQRQPRPAPQRCAPGVELQDGQREHAMATGSSLPVGTVPSPRRGPTAHHPMFRLPPHPPMPVSRRSPRGQGHRRGPTSVRMGRQLSRTQVPLHSWLRVHPSPHQPQPMKRSARRQRSQVKKWRQPGPVTFTRHTWGHRMEVSRGRGGSGPTSRPGPPPAHLGAGGEEQRVLLQPHRVPQRRRLLQREVGQGDDVGAGALQHHLQRGGERGSAPPWAPRTLPQPTASTHLQDASLRRAQVGHGDVLVDGDEDGGEEDAGQVPVEQVHLVGGGGDEGGLVPAAGVVHWCREVDLQPSTTGAPRSQPQRPNPCSPLPEHPWVWG